jgi:beta-glucanase (GH16 family)
VSRRGFLGLGVLGLAAGVVGCSPTGDRRGSPSASPTPQPATSSAGWQVVWQDDFADGLDTAVWTPADYGGNRDLGELQYNDPAMVSVENGNLVLRAQASGRDGYDYVAGSVSTKDKLTIGPYGRLTTRQLLGPGAGIGFAVALYGEDIDEVGWPACGEIDATEIALARPESPFASIHGPGYSGGSPISATGNVPSLVNRWAEHTLDWEPARIAWAIDGQVYQVAEAADPRAAGGWPFDQPFFLTMVLTIGSTLSGPVDVETWPHDASGAPTDPYAAVDLVRFEQRASS